MTNFKIGDRVEAIDDVVSGVVRKIVSDRITVESDEGFELIYAPSELILVSGTKEIKVSHFDIARIKGEKETIKKQSFKYNAKKEAYVPVMEVDLHINQLLTSTKGMTNYEMLNLQLETAKRQLEFAIKKKIQKVVFIHGVGEGVLKEELFYLLNRYDNLKYYDANYQKYGLGATEVYIYQNP